MSLFFFPLRRSSVFEFQKRGQGILLSSRLCHTYFVRIFQNLFIRLFHIPVLKPGFPSLFQHGQPEGIRRRQVWVPVYSGTVGEKAHYIWRSVDLFVYSIFVVYGPAYGATSGPVPEVSAPTSSPLLSPRTKLSLWRIFLLLLLQLSHMNTS